MNPNTNNGTMAVFELSEGHFSTRSRFHHYLSNNHGEIADGNLYICSGVTELSTEEFIKACEQQGWEHVRSYGAIELIRTEYQEGHAETYFSVNEKTGLFFLYTDQRKSEEIDNAILPLLRDLPESHYLYIGPRVIRDLCEEIASEWESSRVTMFIAKRTPGTEIRAKRRPDTERTINYYGEDGLHSLREVEKDYGVLPHTVEIHLPDKLRFRVNKKGIFTLKKGNLKVLFEYMDTCIRQTLAMKQAYDATDFEILEIRDYEIPESTPATILLTNKMELDEIRAIRSKIHDSNYTLLDDFIDESDPSLSTKVFDSEENLFFNLEVSTQEMRIFPREKSRMSVFLRFFEFVQSEIDDRATPRADVDFALIEGQE